MSKAMKRPVTIHTVERFLRISGFGPSRFGRVALNDTAFVSRLRAGESIGPKREEKIAQFLKSYIREQRAIVVKLNAFLGGEIDD